MFERTVTKRKRHCLFQSFNEPEKCKFCNNVCNVLYVCLTNKIITSRNINLNSECTARNQNINNLLLFEVGLKD